MRVNLDKKEERDRINRALLRATLRLAAAHGFTSLGLREVARAAGIAPTSFYRHFADMEELGLSLISDLVRPFVSDWVAHGGSSAVAFEEGRIDGIVSRALLGVSADPELMRFVLAERLGPIVSFRTELARELSVMPAAIQSAWAAEAGLPKSKVPSQLVEAAAVLLLEGCGQLLEQGQEHAPAVRKRVIAQMRALLSGVARNGGKT